MVKMSLNSNAMITADKLKEMGFTSVETFDRDSERDNFDTLKYVTHNGKILSWIELEVTETYMRAEDLNDAWIYDSVSVELVMGDMYQELPISDIKGIEDLIDLITTGSITDPCKNCCFR